MEAILKLLASELSFLYKNHEFRIVDSLYHESFGGSGYVVLDNSKLCLRITNSRDGTFLEFGQSKKNPRWFSFDLIQGLMFEDTKYRFYDDKVSKENIRKLSDHMQGLSENFEKENFQETISILKAFERERATKLFK